MKLDNIPTPIMLIAFGLFFGVGGYKFFGAETDPPPSSAQQCRIKGDVSLRTGKRVFYVPGQRDYARIGIDKDNGDRWFCTEVDAFAAGWTKSPR